MHKWLTSDLNGSYVAKGVVANDDIALHNSDPVRTISAIADY